MFPDPESAILIFLWSLLYFYILCLVKTRTKLYNKNRKTKLPRRWGPYESKYQQKIELITKYLQEGEKIEHIARFNAIPSMILYIAAAIGCFILGRIFAHVHAILLLTSILSMWLMAGASRAIYESSNSCIVITNKRTIGKIGEKEINCWHHQIKNLVCNRVLFIDGGDAQSSVLLKNVSNRQELYSALIAHSNF